MRSIYLFLILFLSLILELLAGCIGIPVFLTAGTVFYAAYVYGPACGFTAAVAAGIVLDLMQGYYFPVSILSFSCVAAGGVLWLRKVDSSSLLLLVLPGAFLPLTGYLLPEIVHSWRGTESIFTSLSVLLTAGVLSSFLFPLWIILLDIPGNLLQLGVFGDARDRLKRREE